jgi:small subunit ribosomal protein S20
MANIKSAKKRIRVIEVKTQRNRRVKSHLKAILKSLETAIETGDQKTARDKLALAEKRLQQAASKGTIHKNAASRKVARITAQFTKTFGQEALLVKAEKPAIVPKTKASAEAETPAEEKAAKSTKKSTKKESAEESVAAAQTPEPETEEVAAETEEVSAESEAEPTAEEATEAAADEAEEITEEAPVAEPEAAEEAPADEAAEAPAEEEQPEA